MGYLDPPEFNYPTCPVCGWEAEEFYFDINDNICGCDQCISKRDAVEYMAEKEEDARELAEEQRAEWMIEERRNGN